MIEDNVLTDINGQLMIGGAHRYYLGRRTYAVSSCIEWLRRNWNLVSEQTRFTILRDTASAIVFNEAGAEMDTKAWIHFFYWGVEQDPDFGKQIRDYLDVMTSHLPKEKEMLNTLIDE